jgi:ribosomal protein S18 acetylase RimI-like enzyme
MAMLRIRPATKTEAGVVAFLIRRSFEQQIEVLGLSEVDCPKYVGFETESGVLRRMAAGVHVVLASLDNEGMGTISWALSRNDAASGEIMRLAILPTYRRNGYGRELMTYAETQLMSAGALVARLSIVTQFGRLQAYYEQHGYAVAEVRRVPSLPFELTFMEKQLG